MHPAVPAAPLTEADVLAALRDCYDPDVPLNIVDLGLVHNIAIAPDPDAPGAGIPGVPQRQRVHIALTPVRLADTESDAASLIAQIQNRLAAFQTIHHTEVSLLNHPVWTPDRISPEGYAHLSNRLTSKQPSNALIQIKVSAKA
jgi:metal-sulfur cluster biosynthetic enzyme